MFINARPDALGLIAGMAQRAPVQPTSAATAVSPASRATGRREDDPDQLRFFLSNITRADASALIALTEKAGNQVAGYEAVVKAYGDA